METVSLRDLTREVVILISINLACVLLAERLVEKCNVTLMESDLTMIHRSLHSEKSVPPIVETTSEPSSRNSAATCKP